MSFDAIRYSYVYRRLYPASIRANVGNLSPSSASSEYSGSRPYVESGCTLGSSDNFKSTYRFEHVSLPPQTGLHCESDRSSGSATSFSLPLCQLIEAQRRSLLSESNAAAADFDETTTKRLDAATNACYAAARNALEWLSLAYIGLNERPIGWNKGKPGSDWSRQVNKILVILNDAAAIATCLLSFVEELGYTIKKLALRQSSSEPTARPTSSSLTAATSADANSAAGAAPGEVAYNGAPVHSHAAMKEKIENAAEKIRDTVSEIASTFLPRLFSEVFSEHVCTSLLSKRGIEELSSYFWSPSPFSVGSPSFSSLVAPAHPPISRLSALLQCRCWVTPHSLNIDGNDNKKESAVKNTATRKSDVKDSALTLSAAEIRPKVEYRMGCLFDDGLPFAGRLLPCQTTARILEDASKRTGGGTFAACFGLKKGGVGGGVVGKESSPYLQQLLRTNRPPTAALKEAAPLSIMSASSATTSVAAAAAAPFGGAFDLLVHVMGNDRELTTNVLTRLRSFGGISTSGEVGGSMSGSSLLDAAASFHILRHPASDMARQVCVDVLSPLLSSIASLRLNAPHFALLEASTGRDKSITILQSSLFDYLSTLAVGQLFVYVLNCAIISMRPSSPLNVGVGVSFSSHFAAAKAAPPRAEDATAATAASLGAGGWWQAVISPTIDSSLPMNLTPLGQTAEGAETARTSTSGARAPSSLPSLQLLVDILYIRSWIWVGGPVLGNRGLETRQQGVKSPSAPLPLCVEDLLAAFSCWNSPLSTTPSSATASPSPSTTLPVLIRRGAVVDPADFDLSGGTTSAYMHSLAFGPASAFASLVASACLLESPVPTSTPAAAKAAAVSPQPRYAKNKIVPYTPPQPLLSAAADAASSTAASSHAGLHAFQQSRYQLSLIQVSSLEPTQGQSSPAPAASSSSTMSPTLPPAATTSPPPPPAAALSSTFTWEMKFAGGPVGALLDVSPL